MRSYRGWSSHTIPSISMKATRVRRATGSLALTESWPAMTLATTTAPETSRLLLAEGERTLSCPAHMRLFRLGAPIHVEHSDESTVGGPKFSIPRACHFIGNRSTVTCMASSASTTGRRVVSETKVTSAFSSLGNRIECPQYRTVWMSLQ
jgi:hypothetical protein